MLDFQEQTQIFTSRQDLQKGGRRLHRQIGEQGALQTDGVPSFVIAVQSAYLRGSLQTEGEVSNYFTNNFKNNRSFIEASKIADLQQQE